DLRRRMDGAIEVLRKEFAGLRTGRASASLLDPVQVEAYGNKMPLTQVGTVSVPEPRLIIVQVWDKADVKATEKGIRESGLGLNPQSEGQTIRVPVPDLSEERRKELTRVAAKYTEQARVSVREVRRTLTAAAELGISYLTLFGFSSENWKRPSDEVDDLMGLLRVYLRGEIAELHRQGVRVRIIGDRTRLAPDIVTLIANAEQLTAGNSRLNLIVALSYGGRHDIVQAARRLAAEAAAGRLAPDRIE